MGSFNSLYYTDICPMCNKRHQIQVEMRIGYKNQVDYKIGDKIDWGHTWGYGPRPENGNLIDEGYVECEKRHKDYWVDVIIENDIITAVKYRPDKKGYIPD